jgi:hypothetical protein
VKSLLRAATAVDAPRIAEILILGRSAFMPYAPSAHTDSELRQWVQSTVPSPVRLYTFQENTGARRFYERHGFVAIQFTNGETNEEHCPDVLYERP